MCKSVYLTISLLLSAVLVGCNNHNHAGHSHDDGHEHSEYEHHHDDDEHDHDEHEKDDCEDKKVNVINGHSHNEDFHSKDEEGIKNPTMMGIFLDIDAADNKITFVATDMFHLSQVKSSIVEASGNCSVILPANAAKLLKTILGKEGEDVVVSWDAKNILFELNDFTLVCRQIEGNFPNYKNAISIQWNKELVIDRNSLISAVRHIEPFAEQSNKGVKFDVRENQITVSAQSLDLLL